MVDAREQLMPGFNPEAGVVLVDHIKLPSPGKLISDFQRLARRIKIPNLDPIKNVPSNFSNGVSSFIEKHPILAGTIYGVVMTDAVIAVSYLDPTQIQRGPGPLVALGIGTALGAIVGVAIGMGEEDSRQYR